MKKAKGIEKALKLFKKVYNEVPAYKSFLLKNKIDVSKINDEYSFRGLPMVEKKNYLKYYKYLDLFPGQVVPSMVSASSGSSGSPFYWPRGDRQEETGADAHEQIFKNIFRIEGKRTLVINCFSMGNWVAGTYTTACCRALSRRGYDLSIITPSLERNDTLLALRDFAKYFEVVILAGYPPLIMDLLLDAVDNGIDIKKLNLRILTAGESFSEKWREYLLDLLGKKDVDFPSINIYGTADAGLMGHETPLSITLRKIALKNEMLSKKIFGSFGPRATLVQYYPEVNYFEQIGEELCFTSDSGLPLIKYKIGDKGKLFTPSDMDEIIKQTNCLSKAESVRLGKWLSMPLLVLFGRNDVSVTYYALNIYPEHLKAGLEHKSVIGKVSGRFQASVKIVKKGAAQKLIIGVELKKNIKSTAGLKRTVERHLFESLMKLNSEYNKLFKTLGQFTKPVVILDEYGNEKYQVKKAKVAWVKKQ